MKKVLILLLFSLSVNAQNKTGIQLQEIKPGSIYEKLGLKAGDIILKINEHQMTGKESLESLSDEFSRTKKIRVLIQRDGKEEILKYTVK